MKITLSQRLNADGEQKITVEFKRKNKTIRYATHVLFGKDGRFTLTSAPSKLDFEKIERLLFGLVQKRIREIRTDADYADELKVLEQHMVFFEKEAEIKRSIKDGEKELEKKVLTKYPALTLDEIKVLVVERKWMDELSRRVLGEVDRLSRKLAGRVKELAERYAEPLPELTQEVEELAVKVEGHLAQMGFNLK